MGRNRIQDRTFGPRRNVSRALASVWLMLAGFVALMLCAGVRAQSQTLSEYQVKAAYLFNFSKFVQWPPGSFPDPESPLVIGIVGQDPFGTALQELVRSVHGRKAVIEHLNWDQDLSDCHILFIGRSERRHIGIIMAKVKGKSVLTVSEMDDFSAIGGIIGFVFDDDRVRFEINLDQAAKSQLKISSQLSSMARAVKVEEIEKENAMPLARKVKEIVPHP